MGGESGLHQVWCCKGSAGVKCCMQCQNIVLKSWMAADSISADSYCKSYLDVHTLSDCKLHTKATVLAIVDDLAAAKSVLRKGEMEKKRLTLGGRTRLTICCMTTA
eukprot:4749882-Pyramimonas_sp.AAC.1